MSQTSSELDREHSFTSFESGQVRPLALSLDGQYLYALNTPDNRLEIFAVLPSRRLQNVASVPVGLDPVAVAVRSATEVWVVNHPSKGFPLRSSASLRIRLARSRLPPTA